MVAPTAAIKQHLRVLDKISKPYDFPCFRFDESKRTFIKPYVAERKHLFSPLLFKLFLDLFRVFRNSLSVL